MAQIPLGAVDDAGQARTLAHRPAAADRPAGLANLLQRKVHCVSGNRLSGTRLSGIRLSGNRPKRDQAKRDQAKRDQAKREQA
jgi:hypothetical protein